MRKQFNRNLKQAGTGPSWRHIQGSKIAKGLPSVNLQYTKIEYPKKWTERRAKRGTLPKLSRFLSQLKGRPFGEKKFRKKSLNAEKLKGGPFGIFKHPICCKISKKLKGDPSEKIFYKKVSQCRKTERGTLWGFSTSIMSQNIKKLKGENFYFRKSLAVPKK